MKVNLKVNKVNQLNNLISKVQTSYNKKINKIEVNIKVFIKSNNKIHQKQFHLHCLPS